MKHYLRQVLRSKNLIDDLLRPRVGTKQKVLIDYSSPNIAKQFHVGNFRSTLIGCFLDSINRAAGNEVVSLNYLGDWGTQFAVIVTLWPDFKPSDELWKSATNSEKIKLLTQCYVAGNRLKRTNADFSSQLKQTVMEMETQLLLGNLEHPYLKFWSEVKAISVNHLNYFYNELNVHHDVTVGESEEIRGSNRIVNDLVKKGLTKKTADGLTVVSMPGIDGYIILKKSYDGSLYFTRDLASIIRRDEIYGADCYLYVVDHSQTRHFEFLKAVLELLGKKSLADRVKHISFGRVKGLSTRIGKSEAVIDILERGVSLAQKFILDSNTVKVDEHEAYEVAKTLAISAIIVNDLKRRRASDYIFSFEGAFNMKQTNGLLLQMKHSRLVSLEKHNCRLMKDLLSDWSYELEVSVETLPLITHLRAFDDALFGSFMMTEPCRVTTYLLKLANLLGSTMASLNVSEAPVEVALPRLLMFAAARRVLNEGMKLLGIKPLDKM